MRIASRWILYLSLLTVFSVTVLIAGKKYLKPGEYSAERSLKSKQFFRKFDLNENGKADGKPVEPLSKPFGLSKRRLEEDDDDHHDDGDDDDDEHEGEHTGAETGHAEHHMPGEVLVTFFVAGCLLVGGIMREIKGKTGIPYTPLILVSGMLMGIYCQYLGDFGKAFLLVLNINPHGILMIFIPTIIFESAYNSDPFTIKRQIYQILLLAGPGVISGALLIALGFNYILGYSSELPLSGALTFGSIV